MSFMAVTQMINFEVMDDGIAALVINNLLDSDFRQFMSNKGWEYVEIPDLPLFFTGYVITNPKAIAELERRSKLNPWFAFSNVDKYP